MNLAINLLLAVLTTTGYIHGHYINCNLHTGAGCRSSPGFTFVKQSARNTPNSLCNKNYLVSVSVPHNASGFYCYFYMDAPEYERIIYSISDASRSFDKTTIYGYGKDANIKIKNYGESQYFANKLSWKQAHTHSFNGYSWIRWTLSDYKATMSASNANYNNLGHPNFLTPTNTNMKIGLNRHHSQERYGSGLCRAYCRFTFASFPALSASVKQSGPAGRFSGPTVGPPGVSNIEGDDPDGTTAPSMEDLEKLSS
ncbi:hypothetical protein EB796_007834 [Bugula neritina]|uniref:Uncharacterized protein n=1 Tax=Bugula neritina TaxID=10212 RepID=A0A7J7K5E6_BUGNE|nr:hypothetical protein EB796_007834 [Bugula neritina]